jgi:hypothetical protein
VVANVVVRGGRQSRGESPRHVEGQAVGHAVEPHGDHRVRQELADGHVGGGERGPAVVVRGAEPCGGPEQAVVMRLIQPCARAPAGAHVLGEHGHGLRVLGEAPEVGDGVLRVASDPHAAGDGEALPGPHAPRRVLDVVGGRDLQQCLVAHVDAAGVGGEQIAVRRADVLVVRLPLEEPAVERQRARPVPEGQLRRRQLGRDPGVAGRLGKHDVGLAPQEIDAGAEPPKPHRPRIVRQELVDDDAGPHQTLRVQQDLHVRLAQAAIARVRGQERLHRGERLFDAPQA